MRRQDVTLDDLDIWGPLCAAGLPMREALIVSMRELGREEGGRGGSGMANGRDG